MTVREFAEKMGRTYETIIRWLAKDMVPGAYREEITETLSIWRIPESALQMEIPKSGPKPATAAAQVEQASTAKPARKAKKGASKK